MSSKCFILSGPIHTGKSTSLMKWVMKEKIDNHRIFHGIINPKIDGEKWFINASNLEKFKMEALLDEPYITVGKFTFSKSAFERAEAIIMNDHSKPGEVFIIDEVGKLELEGKGFDRALRAVLNSRKTEFSILILVVRDFLVDDVIKTYGLHDVSVIHESQLNEI